MTDADDVYFVTGYSENAYTSLSTNQVRIEGQFRISMEDPVPDGIDPCNANETICSDRLAKRIYYKVSLKKEVEFDLTYGEGDNVVQLYNAKHEKMTSTSVVELSDEFDYWSPRNECPALFKGYDPGSGIHWDGWLDANDEPAGIIPYNANSNSGMDFILGGSTDVHVVVVTKLIVNENNVPIKTQSETTSTVDIWQSSKVEAGTVKEHYLSKEDGLKMSDHDPHYSWGRRGDYTKRATKTITVSGDGYGTIYDYNIPTGMIGIQEIAKEDTITDKAGKVWTYDHTYYTTEYVKRNISDTTTKYHYTKDYIVGTDEWPLSVPEVLGPYTMDDGTSADEPFVEFYIYNVYRPTNTTVKVHKYWKKENGDNYEGELQQDVNVDIGRYKLVPDDSFNYNEDDRGKIEIWQENYKTTVFVNDRDLRVGDTVTLELKRQYHEDIRYSVNGGERTQLTVYEENHQPEWVTDTIELTVPPSGNLFVSFDDEWNSVSRSGGEGQGQLIVKKGSQVLENVNTGYMPSSPADKPNMMYCPEMETYIDPEDGTQKQRVKVFDTLTLSGSSWEAESDPLALYDENGNQYQYFIIEEHGAEQTMHVIGTNGDGTVMTANTPDLPLEITNVVPSTTITIRKISDSSAPLPGAEFNLYKMEKQEWRLFKSGITFDTQTAQANVDKLFDGRYMLIETKAPDNYIRLRERVYFNIINQQAKLADEDGGLVLTANMIEIGDGNGLNVKNEPGGALQIVKSLTEGSNGNDEDFTFTVSLKDKEGHDYSGKVALTDKNHSTPTDVDVVGGSLEVVITGAGTAKLDDLPVGTTYEVTEASKEGWQKVGEVAYGDDTQTIAMGDADTATITNAKLGALSITKIVKLGDDDLSGSTVPDADKTIADGNYMFSIAGPVDNTSTDPTPVVKYVQITVTRGVAASYMIADTESAITGAGDAGNDGDTSGATPTVKAGDGALAVITGLIPGSYVIKEIGKNGLELTSATVGNTSIPTPANDSVTVTVMAGDTTPMSEAAIAAFTNTAYKVSVKIRKVDKDHHENLLSGAKFKLLKWNEESKEYALFEGPNTETNANGELSFGESLASGEYQIRETKMPDGYIKVDNNDIYFTVNKDGTMIRHMAPTFTRNDQGQITGVSSWNNTENNVIAAGSKVAEVEYAMSNHEATFTVGNTPGASLPATGGPGTTLYYAAGTALLLLAVATLIFRKKAGEE